MKMSNLQKFFAQILGEFSCKNRSLMLIFCTCANYLSILEFDLTPCCFQWNQASATMLRNALQSKKLFQAEVVKKYSHQPKLTTASRNRTTCPL